MPIELITGLPGNAKTLYGIQSTVKRAKEENRPIYYDGIKELIEDDPRLQGTSWTKFDSSKWHEVVPSGSLIFIDEAQKIFRARNMGATPPVYVTELEEHRHKGIDFVMTTQHPRLIDPAVKVLTQTHRHMVRVSGFEMSTVHKWDSIKAEPDKPAGRKDSEKVRWSFPKELYGVYKSADEHTIKKSIPGRVKLLGVLLLLLIAMGWYLTSYFAKKTAASEQSSTATVDSPFQATTPPQGGFRSEAFAERALPPDPVADAEQYVFKETPRVSGLPYTAPKYDTITVPTRAPVPAMCVQIGSAAGGGKIDCRCYTQQATRIPDMEFNMCIEFARNGHFQDFDAEPQRQEQRVERSREAIAPIPDVPLRENYGAPQVIAFNETPASLSAVRPSTNPDNGPPNRPNVRIATVPAPAVQ